MELEGPKLGHTHFLTCITHAPALSKKRAATRFEEVPGLRPVGWEIAAR